MSTVSSVKDGAVLSFYTYTHAFPDTKEGVLLQADFKFKNEGNAPLVISDYKVSCSCTKVKLPKTPVLPGEEGVIQVSFDTNDKYGYQNRTIELVSNSVKKVGKLRFKVVVIPKNELQKD